MVKRGRMFRRVTVVPYGRMQYVEVNAGPVARALGLARVQLAHGLPGNRRPPLGGSGGGGRALARSADGPRRGAFGGAVTPEAPAPPEEWTRLHVVTPLLLGGPRGRGLRRRSPSRRAGRTACSPRRTLRRGLPLAAIVLVVVVASAISFGEWWMNQFRVDDDAVHQRKGILFRQYRQARLDRLQAVDVVQPLVARVFGFAEVKVEVAGGKASSIRLQYLRLEDAEAVAQRDRRARGWSRTLAGAPPATSPVPAAGLRGEPIRDGRRTRRPRQWRARRSPDPRPPARRAPVAAAPTARGLLGARRTAPRVDRRLVVDPHDRRRRPRRHRRRRRGGRRRRSRNSRGTRSPTAGESRASSAAGRTACSRDSSPSSPSGGPASPRASASRRRSRPTAFGFSTGSSTRVARPCRPAGCRRSGCGSRSPWRRFDWWRITINVAGYQDEEQAETTLLPVGPRRDALYALWLVLPDLGDPDPAGTVSAALSGAGADNGFTATPRRAWIVDPWQWRRRGVLATGRALLIRQRALRPRPRRRAPREDAVAVHPTGAPSAPLVARDRRGPLDQGFRQPGRSPPRPRATRSRCSTPRRPGRARREGGRAPSSGWRRCRDEGGAAMKRGRP